MNISCVDKEKCFGCLECVQICPKKCISYTEDAQGLVYPYIQQEQCIDCGICYKKCPTNIEEKNSVLEFKAVKNFDNIRMKSASGGMFTMISDYVLEQNGVVYGAAFDDDLSLTHIRVENKRHRDKCCGSKYVQSKILDMFPLIEQDLNNKRQVLFSGTPCQVAAVKSYFGKNDFLLLVDIICHGVIGKKVFDSFLTSVKKRNGSKIKTISFRDKRKGWSSQQWNAVLENGKELEDKELSSYKTLYYSHCAHRESCFTCKYASLNRPGDITLGDYWGIDEYYPEFNDEKGVSLVLVNTEKGKSVVEQLRIEDRSIVCTKNQCLQPQLQEPVHNHPKRKNFQVLYKVLGYNMAVKMCCKENILKRMARKVLWYLGGKLNSNLY